MYDDMNLDLDRAIEDALGEDQVDYSAAEPTADQLEEIEQEFAGALDADQDDTDAAEAASDEGQDDSDPAETAPDADQDDPDPVEAAPDADEEDDDRWEGTLDEAEAAYLVGEIALRVLKRAIVDSGAALVHGEGDGRDWQGATYRGQVISRTARTDANGFLYVVGLPGTHDVELRTTKEFGEGDLVRFRAHNVRFWHRPMPGSGRFRPVIRTKSARGVRLLAEAGTDEG